VLLTIATQAALVIESERTRESLEFAIVIQERNRLAREIHDGLAQTLAYLKLQTAQMQRALAQDDLDALKDLLNQNYSALADAYLDARQAIDNLRLTPQKGISQWLEQAAVDFEHLSGIPVRQSFDKVPAEIPSEVQAQLIRIVQEVFSNIRKHAKAKQAWIVLKEWEGDLVLEVGDDGQGFQPDDVPGLSQYGLRGMRERAELIGADFQIASRPGEGTVVYVRLPSKSWEIFQ
jgi:two-component system nitrate/nitrite sensor histidine kinase NarX